MKHASSRVAPDCLTALGDNPEETPNRPPSSRAGPPGAIRSRLDLSAFFGPDGGVIGQTEPDHALGKLEKRLGALELSEAGTHVDHTPARSAVSSPRNDEHVCPSSIDSTPHTQIGSSVQVAGGDAIRKPGEPLRR
jgi:hypothetical protein